eukprot:31328-Pelagococcus_subviridis.AAC.4
MAVARRERGARRRRGVEETTAFARGAMRARARGGASTASATSRARSDSARWNPTRKMTDFARRATEPERARGGDARSRASRATPPFRPPTRSRRTPRLDASRRGRRGRRAELARTWSEARPPVAVFGATAATPRPANADFLDASGVATVGFTAMADMVRDAMFEV